MASKSFSLKDYLRTGMAPMRYPSSNADAPFRVKSIDTLRAYQIPESWRKSGP
jgi:hypothetical protein